MGSTTPGGSAPDNVRLTTPPDQSSPATGPTSMCGNGVVSPVAEWIGVRLACELARDNEFEAVA